MAMQWVARRLLHGSTRFQMWTRATATAGRVMTDIYYTCTRASRKDTLLGLPISGWRMCSACAVGRFRTGPNTDLGTGHIRHMPAKPRHMVEADWVCDNATQAKCIRRTSNDDWSHQEWLVYTNKTQRRISSILKAESVNLFIDQTIYVRAQSHRPTR